jgi:hypothetical protein
MGNFRDHMWGGLRDRRQITGTSTLAMQRLCRTAASTASRGGDASLEAMLDDDYVISRSQPPGEPPDWLQPSRRQRLWSRLRVFLDQSLGIPTPSYLAHNGAPIGPRRIFRRIRGDVPR